MAKKPGAMEREILVRRATAVLWGVGFLLLMIGGRGVLAATRAGAWEHHMDLAAPAETLPLGLGSCVSASADGLLAIGSGRDRDIGVDAGTVTLWQPASGGGSPIAVIPHPKGSTSSGFGLSVALDPRGSLLCIGAPHETGGLGWPDGFQVGRVYIYALDRGGPRLEWRLTTVLDSPTDGARGSAGGHFGASVATDGVHVVVGSPDDSGQAFASGRCDVFVQGDGGWKHAAHFPSPTGEMTGRFGQALAIDGEVIAVGWSQADGSFPNQGRADLFFLSRQPKHEGWYHGAVLHSPTPTHAGMFGASITVDGELIAVGAPREWTEREMAQRTGQIHLWRVNRADALRARFVESIAPPQSVCDGVGGVRPEAFGMSLALRGPLLAVGATEACGLAPAGRESVVLEGSGCVHVMERSGGSWTATARLQSPRPMAEVHDGWSVAMSAEGQPWIAAARLGDLEAPAGPGRVMVFTAARAAEDLNGLSAFSR
ncbi:MAG: hypothetical protein ACKO4V_03470 [Planctomycetota bacterium]